MTEHILKYQQTFKISRHIAPVTDETLGCQIFVTNLTFGGLKGYVSGILISNWNLAPS